MSSTPASDVRAGDIAAGLLTAGLALGGMVATMIISPLGHAADSVGPAEVLVPVRAVHSGPPGMPPRTDEATPPTDTGTVRIGPPGSTAVAPRPADAPLPGLAGERPPRPRGGIRGLPRLSSPPTSALPDFEADPTTPGLGPGGPTVAPGTADPATSPDDPYAYVDPANEDPDAEPGTGVVGEPDGDGGSGGDPFAAHALSVYRARLQRWLSPHFVVSGSGLSKDVLQRVEVRARLELGADRRVLGYTLQPSKHAAIDTAARRALQAVVGQTAPQLPEHYPGPLQRWVSVTFVCSEDRCN